MDISSVKSIVDASGTLINWSLAIVAGSLAALLSTSYLRPVKGLAKGIYILFVPGWFFLGLVAKRGIEINQISLMAAIHPDDPQQISTAIIAMNQPYADQLNFFSTALLFFGLWLLLFLIWWFFTEERNSGIKNASGN